MIDVCQLLKETRLSRGLSLEEVAQRTYIKGHYLEALEEGWLDRLPAPVHTFGYIRLYAKLLGLDGGALVAQFQQQKGLSTSSSSGSGKLNGKSGGSGPLTDWAAGFMAYRPGAQGPASSARSTPSNGHTEPTNGYTVAPANGHAESPLPRYTAPGGHPRQAPSPYDQPPATLSDSAEMREAQLTAQQVLSNAERDAQQLVRGAESYADDVLSTLEGEIDKALQIIRNGREFLQMRREPGSQEH